MQTCRKCWKRSPLKGKPDVRYHPAQIHRRGQSGFPPVERRDRIVGYIEAKPPEMDNGRPERTEQIKRYRQTFPISS